MSNSVKPFMSVSRKALRQTFSASVAACAIAAFSVAAAHAANQTTYEKEDLVLVTTVINPYIAS